MNLIRNTIAVFIGLFIALFIISLGIHLNPRWITFDEFAPFKHWSSFLKSVQHDSTFFLFLLVFSGLGSIVGGVITAFLVKYAKVAYALLIGFILLFISLIDIIIFPYHPTFYKISIFLTFFPFAWIGGKIVEIIYDKKKKKNKQ